MHSSVGGMLDLRNLWVMRTDVTLTCECVSVELTGKGPGVQTWGRLPRD